MGKQIDLFEWMAHHRGNLRSTEGPKGRRFLYRWHQDGVTRSINFPAGTPLEFIQSKVLEVEAGLLRRKLGIEDAFEQQQKAKLTLRELRNWYVELAEKEGLAKRTVYLRKNAIDRLIRFAGEDCLARNITRDRLNDFKRELLVTNSSAGARIMLLKVASVFRKADYENKIVRYPFTGFEYPRGGRSKERPVLTFDELPEVDKLFTSESMCRMWRILRITGMRGNDASGLRIEDIDFDKKIIRFESKKLKRIEEIPLHPVLGNYLSGLVGQTGPLFNYSFGSVSIEFSAKVRMLKGNEFRPVGSHTPRHSLAAYFWNELDWPEKDVAAFLCHHPSSVTYRYIHENMERIRPQVEALPFR